MLLPSCGRSPASLALHRIAMNKIIEYIIPVTLIVLGIFSVIFTALTEYIVELPFYIGLTGIVISYGLRYWRKKVSNYLISVVLLAGTFGLVSFFFANYSFSLTISDITIIKFHPVVLILLFIHLYINREEFDKLFATSSSTANLDVDKPDNLEVQRMKNSFSSKSIEELQHIINNPNQYRNEAVQAASELLTEKNAM